MTHPQDQPASDQAASEAATKAPNRLKLVFWITLGITLSLVSGVAYGFIAAGFAGIVHSMVLQADIDRWLFRILLIGMSSVCCLIGCAAGVVAGKAKARGEQVEHNFYMMTLGWPLLVFGGDHSRPETGCENQDNSRPSDKNKNTDDYD